MTHTKYTLYDGDFYAEQNGQSQCIPYDNHVVKLYNSSGKPGHVHLDSHGGFVLTQEGQTPQSITREGMLRLLNSIEDAMPAESQMPRPATSPCPIPGPYAESLHRGKGLLISKRGGTELALSGVIHELNRLHNALEQARKARNIAELRLKSKDLEVAKDRIDAKIEALDKEGLGHD